MNTAFLCCQILMAASTRIMARMGSSAGLGNSEQQASAEEGACDPSERMSRTKGLLCARTAKLRIATVARVVSTIVDGTPLQWSVANPVAG
jgi:hypothetical protein